jgi:5'-nucleotidase
MNILVTNDDGIHSPGIQALVSAFSLLGTVAVVAPDRERSAVGHALTLHHPLRVFPLRDGYYAVDGTPTDCVNLGINHLLKNKPDIVVSGINRGANLADDVTYSGTVSAALEATLMGIPAMAVSLVTSSAGVHYDAAAAAAVRIATSLVSHGLPPDTFLNVNVPDLPAAELQPLLVTCQGKRRYGGSIVAKTDPRGGSYYWIGGGESDFLDLEGTDYHAVSRGHISVTPLHYDMTNHRSLSILSRWELS